MSTSAGSRTRLQAAELAAYAAGLARRLPSSRRMRPFLVLGSPRSGTELVGDLLDSHPMVRCEGEVFRTRRPLVRQYLYGKVVLAAARGWRSWGAKLLYHQLNWFEEAFGSAPVFIRALEADGFTFVVVDRRNPLLQALSYLHADRTQFHFRQGATTRFEPLVVDPVEVIAVLHMIETNARWGRELLADVTTVDVWYEDDLQSPEHQRGAVDRILAALDLPSEPVVSSLIPVAPRDVRDRVANYDELATALSATRYADLL